MEQKILVRKIFDEVINPGNCFHCGLCEGLSNNLFKMKETNKGPIPKLTRKPNIEDVNDLKKIIFACPGRGVPYNFLSKKLEAKKKTKSLEIITHYLFAALHQKTLEKKLVLVE